MSALPFDHAGGVARASVPQHARWSHHTALNLRSFAIGEQRLPPALIHALAWVKWAAAWANRDLLRLDPYKSQAIAAAAQMVAAGECDADFPLSLWHAGAAAQSQTNMNEVLAHLASHPARGVWRLPCRVDADDDVSLGQSAEQVFMAAVQVAVALQAKSRLLPALGDLRAAVLARAAHEPGLGGFHEQLAHGEDELRQALGAVHSLALGGDLTSAAPEAHPHFGAVLASRLATRLDLPLVHAAAGVAPSAGGDALLALHAGLRRLAIVLTRGSRPGRGLGQASPQQSQALAMVAAQVLGHDAALAFAASQWQFEPGLFAPLVALDTLDSLRLLADAMRSLGIEGGAPLVTVAPAAVAKAPRLFASAQTGPTPDAQPRS